ncbi:MAG: PAS domain S-box protein [Ignavibacteriales bacterium]|nr:PAS domain S-box protein [Ignavibacteriales bacterium]
MTHTDGEVFNQRRARVRRFVLVIVLAILFGSAIRLALWFGFSVAVPGTAMQLDIREVLLILGACLTGPWGGALIGLFSGMEAHIRWLPTVVHVILGSWAGWFYYRFVYRRRTMRGVISSWFGLVGTYYFLVYTSVLLAVMVVFPSLMVDTASSLSAHERVFNVLQALVYESVFTFIVSIAIFFMLPERYRVPVWRRPFRDNPEARQNQGVRDEKFLRKSKGHLSVRLMAWFFLLALVPMVVASLFVRDSVSTALLGAEGGKQREIARIIASEVHRYGFRQSHQELFHRKSSSQTLFVIDSIGTYRDHIDSSKIGRNVAEDFTATQVEKMLNGKTGMGIDAQGQFAFGYVPIQGTRDRVIAVQGRKMVDHALIDLQEGIYARLGVSILFICAVAGLVIWILVGRPMSKLTHAARQVGKGDFSATVDTAELEDEVSLLGETFNEMTDNLRGLHREMEAEIAHRRTAEDILREREKQFRLLAEHSTDMISRHDLEGRYLYVSPSSRTLLGWEPEEVVGRSAYDFVHPDDKQIVEDHHRRQLETKASSPFLFRVVRKDGSWIWFESSSQLVADGGMGEAMEIHVASRDVTQRYLAEIALRESEQRLRTVVAHMPVVLFSVNQQGMFTLSEGRGLSALGLKPGEVVGKSVYDVYREFPEALDQIRRALAGEAVAGVVSIGPIVFETHYTHLHNSSGEIVGAIGVAMDVTARRRAEEALQESEKMYKSLIEQSSDPVYMLQNDRLMFVNRAWEELFGYSSAEALSEGFSLLSIVAPESRIVVEERLRRYHSGETAPSRYELRGMRRDGSYVDLDVSVAYLEWKGRPAIQGMYRDITERKRAEEAIRHSQKTESLGVLAGGIAHDFNNLLQAMLGQTSLAMSRIPKDSPAFGNVSKAEHAAHRAAELTRQLLAYSGKGKFDVRPLDLNVLLKENLRFLELAIPKGLTLHEDLAMDLPLIDADAGQLQQVVMNLIINASEAVGDRSGKIFLRTSVETIIPRAVDQWTRATGALTPGEFVLLEVSDDGVGMAAETLRKIFDPFFTTKVTGRGLGLSAVIGIVKGHHGGLRVESEAGRGTSFKIIFPVSADQRPVPVSGSERAALQRYKGCVLLIDDEEPVRDVVKDMLEDAGIKTLLAANGEEGLRSYESQPGEIDLVLLDLSMPGIGGKQTFRLLKGVNPDVKVILSSGYSETEVSDDLRELGLTGFIQKPYRYDKLRELIRDFLPQKE